jgi:hypothetical protein
MNYIFSPAECPFYSVERDMFLKSFLSNSDKFLWLMIKEDIKVIVKLCEYLVKIRKKKNKIKEK